jgi:hypothetical protein
MNRFNVAKASQNNEDQAQGLSLFLPR